MQEIAVELIFLEFLQKLVRTETEIQRMQEGITQTEASVHAVPTSPLWKGDNPGSSASSSVADPSESLIFLTYE